MKMVALRDYLDPYESVIRTINSPPFELPDEKLCEFLIDMGTLEKAPPEVAPAAPAKEATPASTTTGGKDGGSK